MKRKGYKVQCDSMSVEEERKEGRNGRKMRNFYHWHKNRRGFQNRTGERSHEVDFLCCSSCFSLFSKWSFYVFFLHSFKESTLSSYDLRWEIPQHAPCFKCMVTCGECTDLGGYRYNPEHSRHPSKIPCAHLQSIRVSAPSHRQALIYSLSLETPLFWTFPVNGIL